MGVAKLPDDLRVVVDCATPPRRITELCSLIDAARERLPRMRTHVVARSAWTMRDDDGWINHSTADDHAVTIRHGDHSVVLAAGCLSAAEGILLDAPPQPIRELPADDVRDRIDATLSLFRALLVERSARHSRTSGSQAGAALVAAAEARTAEVAEALSAMTGAPLVRVQAPSAWCWALATGPVGGDRRDLADSLRSVWWRDVPPIVRLSVDAPQGSTPGARRSWRVDADAISLEHETEPGGSALDRMRAVARLPAD